MTDRPNVLETDVYIEKLKKFEPGQVVYLNSGSPPLTVVRAGGSTTLVTWINDKGQAQEHTFGTVCLKDKE